MGESPQQGGIDRRNTESVRQALQKMQDLVHEQEAKINAMLGAAANLVARMEWLEQLVFKHKVAEMGHGPTE